MNELRIPLSVALSLRDALAELDRHTWSLTASSEQKGRAIGKCLAAKPFLEACIQQQARIVDAALVAGYVDRHAAEVAELRAEA